MTTLFVRVFVSLVCVTETMLDAACLACGLPSVKRGVKMGGGGQTWRSASLC
ncbi:MAG: hypothetical protein ACRC46_08970 [Thermoguttaceae bacterium]